MSKKKSNYKKEREKIIKCHKKTLSTQIEEREKAREKLTSIKNKVEDVITYIDRDNIGIHNELDLLNKYETRIIGLDNDQWKIYERISNSSMRSEATVKEFTTDVKSFENNLSPLIYTTISSSTSTSSDYSAIHETLKINYSTDMRFIKELEKKAPKDDFWDNVDFIVVEMNKRFKNSGDNFKKSIDSFISASPKDAQLLNIRSKVYYNFFDALIPDESSYCKLIWYSRGITRAKRYCQTKFLIQNGNEDNDLPSSTITEINMLSKEMKRLFDILSNYGKNSTSDVNAEYIIRRELIPIFRSVLEMKI